MHFFSHILKNSYIAGSWCALIALLFSAGFTAPCQANTRDEVYKILTGSQTLPKGWGLLGQGSWVKKGNPKYRDPLTPGIKISNASDHDLRLMIPENVSEEEARRVYLKWRKEIEAKVRRKFGKNSKRVLKSINIYPPNQLMLGVGTKAQAMQRLKDLRLPNPNLGGEELEGIFNKYSPEFIRPAERSGILLVNKNGKMKRYLADIPTNFFPGEKDITKNTLPGVSANVREITHKAYTEALEQGHVDILIKDIERIDGGLRRGMGMMGLSNPRSPDVKNVLKKLKELKRLKKPMDDGLRKEIESVLKRSILQAELLDKYHARVNMAGLTGQSDELAADIARREKELIKQVFVDVRNASGRGKQLVRVWDKIPWEKVGRVTSKVLEGFFVGWDIYSSSLKAGEGDIDGAYRDAALAAIFTAAGLGPGMAALATNILLDYAKDFGADLAVMSQDCDDLLAGIIEVKGWEKADSMGNGGETSVERLVANVSSEKKFRAIVETAIFNAAADNTEHEEVKKKKIAALKTRCMQPLVDQWRIIRRRQLVNYINLRDQLQKLLNQAQVTLQPVPDPALLIQRQNKEKIADVLVMLTWPKQTAAEIHGLSMAAKKTIEQLGGRRHRVLFDPQLVIRWFVDDKPVGKEKQFFSWNLPAQIATNHFTFTTPGDHTITCQLNWRLKIYSTITDAPDFKHGEYRLLSAAFSLQWPGWYEWTVRGDAMASHRGNLGFELPGIVKAICRIKESKLDDSIKAVITGQNAALPAQTISLRVGLNSAVKVDPDSFYYHWSGNVKSHGRTALFTENQPGTYPLQVRVYRNKSREKLLAVTPAFSMQVFAPDQARFGIKLNGPHRVILDSDVTIKAVAFGRNRAGKKILTDGDTFIQWVVGDTIVDTGNELNPAFPEPGQYTVTARLVQEIEGDLRILASARHYISVSGSKAEQNNRNSDDNGHPGEAISEIEKTIKVLQDLSTTTAKTKNDIPDEGFPANDVLVTVEKDTETAFEKLAKEVRRKDKIEEKAGTAPSGHSVPSDGDDSTSDDEFRKLQKKAVEEFKNSTGTEIRPGYTNPDGCPPMTATTVDVATVPPTDETESFVPFDESESAKQPVVIDSDETTSAPCSQGDADCLERERLGIIREPDIPGMGREEKPRINSEGAEKTKKTLPKKEQPTPAFHVQLIPQPNPGIFQPDAKVKILACIDRVSRDSLPLKFTWKGVDNAMDSTAAVTLTQPGSRRVSVNIKGKDGVSGQAYINLDVGKISAVVKQYPQQPVPMGSRVQLAAQVLLNGKPTSNTSLLYNWQPHEDIEFSPQQGATGRTTARFPGPGTYKVWVEVYQKHRPGMSDKRFAQSQQVTITVQGVKASLSAEPSQPMLGQKVTVHADVKSKTPLKLLRFVWDAKGKYKSGKPSADGQSYTFIPADTKPVTVSLKLLAQEGDLQELDSQSISIVARKYTVSVSQPKRIGPTPRIWDPKKGAIVELPQAVAAFQDAEIHCSLSPALPGKISYSWSASPDGCSIAAPYSATTRVNAHKKGSYQILVTVTDANGIMLGTGAGTLVVTVSKRDMEIAAQKAKDLEKAKKLLAQGRSLWKQGKLQQAVIHVADAGKLAGSDKTIASSLQAMRKQKKQIDAKLQQTIALIKQGKLHQAGNVLSSAALISKTYPKYQKVLLQYTDAQKKEETRKQLQEKIKELMDKGDRQEQENELSGAIQTYKKALALQSDSKVSARISKLEKKLRARKAETQHRELLEAKFNKLIKKGYEYEKWDNLQRAITTYKKALTIHADGKISAHIRELEKRIQDRKAEQKRSEQSRDAEFNKLIKKGYEYEKWDNLQRAITTYKKALTIHADGKISAHIRELEKMTHNRKIKQQHRLQSKNDSFNKLIKKGYEQEKKGHLKKAIAAYKHALTIHTDGKISAHIRELEKRQHNRKVKQQRKNKQQRRKPATAKTEKHKQRRAVKQKKQVAPTPWTGTYRGSYSDNDGTLTFTFHLRQKGNRLTGNGSLRAQLLGEDDTGTLTLQGRSSGRSARIQVAGDEGGTMLECRLSTDGNRITTNINGMSIILRRIR